MLGEQGTDGRPAPDTLPTTPNRTNPRVMAALATISTDNQPINPPKEPKTLKVTGKVRIAIEAMVWQGLKRADAAQVAGLVEHSLYVALRSPHVKAHYLAECEVLRTSGRARRIHRLEAMLEQDDNKAAVINAALALDRLTDEALTGRGTQSLPGLQIVVIQGGTAAIQASQPVPAITIEHSSDTSHNSSD